MYPITPEFSPPPTKKQKIIEENNNDISSTTSKTDKSKSCIFTPPTTPTRSNISPLIPATPGFSLHKSNKPAFPGKNIKIENDLKPIQFPGPLQLSLEPIYKDQGIKHNVFKQPPKSKSCWAYSLAMLLTDIIRTEKPLALNDSFWTWFQNADLLNAENVKQKATEIGVSLELTKIPRENSLEHIRNKIAESGFPVLTAIDHPYFSGHAIVVDKVTDKKTTIRDPYSGEVFVIPNEAMKDYYAVEDEVEIEMLEEQNCLSVITQPQINYI
ncbi:MAG: hypothetical protein K1000chlam3_01278 [Chlamydiae bacterium]|nr:hypothetical protein [Chlamydiota bacterium]